MPPQSSWEVLRRKQFGWSAANPSSIPLSSVSAASTTATPKVPLVNEFRGTLVTFSCEFDVQAKEAAFAYAEERTATS